MSTKQGFSPDRDAALLRELARNLPDSALCAAAPDRTAADIRAALERVANHLAPARPMAKPLPLPTAKNTGDAASLSLYTDGASRGNPGEAGAGYVIFDSQGREVFAHGKYLGQCTNNMAEYQALILGLSAAKKQGARQLSVYLDSELIVKQIKGEYRVKDEKLKPFFAQVQRLRQDFAAFRVAHVPRKQNQRADQLANEAIDNKVTSDE